MYLEGKKIPAVGLLLQAAGEKLHFENKRYDMWNVFEMHL